MEVKGLSNLIKKSEYKKEFSKFTDEQIDTAYQFIINYEGGDISSIPHILAKTKEVVEFQKKQKKYESMMTTENGLRELKKEFIVQISGIVYFFRDCFLGHIEQKGAIIIDKGSPFHKSIISICESIESIIDKLKVVILEDKNERKE